MAYPNPMQSSGPISIKDIGQWMTSAGELTPEEGSRPYTLSFLLEKSHLINRTLPVSPARWYGYASQYVNIGPPANPFDIASNGEYIFVSETDNHRVVRYPINGGLGVVIAGTGVAGSSLYQLDRPLGLCATSGGIYVADSGNKRIMMFLNFGTPGRNLGEEIFSTIGNSIGSEIPVNVGGQFLPASGGATTVVCCTVVNSYDEIDSPSPGGKMLMYNMTDRQIRKITTTVGNTDSHLFNSRDHKINNKGLSRINHINMTSHFGHTRVQCFDGTGQNDRLPSTYIVQDRIENNYIPVQSYTFASFNLVGDTNRFVVAKRLTYTNTFFVEVIAFNENTFSGASNINIVQRSANQQGRAISMCCEMYGTEANSPIFILCSPDGSYSGQKYVTRFQNNSFSDVNLGLV